MSKKILIVGGGYSGFYTAWKLEKWLRKGEAEVTLVDPIPYMSYLPFLPEVAAGSIEPRHAVVSRRRHFNSTRSIAGRVTGISHATKTAMITPNDGEEFEFSYDHIVIATGSVSRTFPIPGVADYAFGLKSIEEAVGIRDRLMSNFDKAATLAVDSPERRRLLTVTVIGGGFGGIETVAELRSFATALLRHYREISFEEISFHLVEAMGRIMPEVKEPTADWVVKDLTDRGVNVHLNTQLTSTVDGHVELDSGERFESDIVIWTAGVMPQPFLRGTDLPIGPRGHVLARTDLRVEGENGILEGAWAAGDTSCVPDISRTPGPGGFCVPNAQHAVRQAKLLARNIVANLRGEGLREYNHSNAGAVAGLGINVGVFQSGNFSMKGYFAWLAHRFYHGLAIPSWERKLRVFSGWMWNFFLGRDVVSLLATEHPRDFFEEFAARPAQSAETQAAVPPASQKNASTKKSQQKVAAS